MKKLIIYSVLTILLLITPKSTYAMSKADVQTMIDTAISPINTAVSSLQTTVLMIQDKITAIEASITGILNRLTGAETTVASHEVKLADFSSRINNLENAGPDFQPPASWLPSFSSVNRSLTLTTSKTDKCNWNGVLLTQQVQIRGTAHFPGSDVFAVGNCDVINFTNIINYPPPGTNIPVDLDLFWQEKIKHVQLNLTVL